MAPGIHLTLLVGPVVPVPAPRVVVDALQKVEVANRTDRASGFQLQFKLEKRSPLHTLFLLTGGSSIPVLRVVIVVTFKGIPTPIMDGVVTHHQVTSGANPGESVLTVTGEDVTKAMDFIDMTGIPYPAMPPEARMLTIIGKYAVFGMIPMIIPSFLTEVPIPTERIPRHQGTDLAYARKMAADAGHVFYVEPGPAPGTNFAYWGPEIKTGIPQPALSVDFDAHTNVESLDFEYDPDNTELPVVFIQNQMTRAPIPIPIPAVSPLNPPLGLVPPIPKRIHFLRDTAKESPVRAALRGVARAARSADAVKANGTLNVLRYGHILKARKLVGVRGAGHAYNGLYYVSRVTHTIEKGTYQQRFELARNGLLPTVPAVPT
ncbi:MAG: hypothetical protein EA425_06950 [Puniceicoccaceae bacterium]|nr:MAG: hypothetical protein EA425_06950 [Puniceicoccaceae bacterium]